MDTVIIWNLTLSDILSISSFFISLSTFIYSLVSLHKLVKHQQSEQEDKLFTMLTEASKEYTFSTKDREKEFYFINYVNILEYISYKYDSKKIDKDMFNYNILPVIKGSLKETKLIDYVDSESTRYLSQIINDINNNKI